jgi:two-component system, NarL family, nitrate/nitrite response regulator NarL
MTVEFTTREQQVLRLIAHGRTSKQIAAELGIGLRTVNTHRENLGRKLGNSSVATFVRCAIEAGLTD